MPTQPIYYPVWLRPGATPPYQIGKRYETVREAKDELATQLAYIEQHTTLHQQTIGCVVCFHPQFGKSVMVDTIRPLDARWAVQHYEGMLEQFCRE